MLMPAKKPATTPIPVQLSEAQFNQFILPYLSMPRRGPKCKLGYHRLFNLILWVLYTGIQWKCLPVPKDHNSKAKIHYTTVYRAFARGSDDGSLEHAFIASVKQTPRTPYRNLLIPIDFSASSVLALSVATAYFSEAVVSVLHAYEVLFERHLINSGVPDAELSQQRQKARSEALHRMTTLVHRGRYKPAHVALYAQHGRPATVIRAMTEHLEPDLIMMGRSEQSGLEKLLTGSTTIHVLRELLCDVLIVTPE